MVALGLMAVLEGKVGQIIQDYLVQRLAVAAVVEKEELACLVLLIILVVPGQEVKFVLLTPFPKYLPLRVMVLFSPCLRV
jgi:hypothetical protein